MILAEDLKRLIGRWPFLVNEIVNALLVGYQFVFSLIGGYGLLEKQVRLINSQAQPATVRCY